MREWSYRQEDVRNLLNPAFCGRVLLSAVREHNNKTGGSFPFPLVYLVLPLVLPLKIRREISSRKKLLNWTQEHQELLFDFGARAADLVEVTNEAIELMLQSGLLTLADNGELACSPKGESLSKTKYVDDEVKDCLRKAEHVGRWFASAGKAEAVYICLGVRP